MFMVLSAVLGEYRVKKCLSCKTLIKSFYNIALFFYFAYIGILLAHMSV